VLLGADKICGPRSAAALAATVVAVRALAAVVPLAALLAASPAMAITMVPAASIRLVDIHPPHRQRAMIIIAGKEAAG
jgi:hypothetical protein